MFCKDANSWRKIKKKFFGKPNKKFWILDFISADGWTVAENTGPSWLNLNFFNLLIVKPQIVPPRNSAQDLRVELLKIVPLYLEIMPLFQDPKHCLNK